LKALAFVLVLALTATAGAQQYALPDNRLTPGDVLPVTAEQVCVRGYARVMDAYGGRAREQYAPFGRPKHRLTPEEAQRRKVLVRVERETYEIPRSQDPTAKAGGLYSRHNPSVYAG
jgi:hypothetical protein